MPKGYLVGAFDMLNVRNLDVIEQAASRCDHLAVGVLSDDHVEQRLGRRPVVPLAERVRLVASVRGVESVRVHVGGTSDHDGWSFVMAEDADLVGDMPAMILESRRESVSEILRQALAPSPDRAVA